MDFGPISAKLKLIQEFQQVLREEQSDINVVTGIDRRTQWIGNPGYTPTITSAQNATGNAQNAAIMASSFATKVSKT